MTAAPARAMYGLAALMGAVAGLWALRRRSAISAVRWRHAASDAVDEETTPLLPSATLGEAIRMSLGVIAPTIAKGVIIRRPRTVAIVERFDLDRRAIRILQRLRDERGPGPLLVGPVAGRRWAFVLAPDDVRRVLADTPEPFATETVEKRAALSHFEPKVSLLSHGADRADRRRFNEAVLDHGRSIHRLGETFAAIVNEEAGRLLAGQRPDGEVTWDHFAAAWFRMVRRVVFGDGASEDHELSSLMARLRARANWAFLLPTQPRLRKRLFDRLNEHIARAEPGSLAAVMATVPVTHRTAPDHQVPQWLFAFDPAGMATFRALALLASHPEHVWRAREEIRKGSGLARELPFLRACVLESLRLWPTAPLVLRDSVEETVWGGQLMPAGTGVIIFAPFFHRDGRRVPFADRFAPDVWLQPDADEKWAFVPFSLGSGRCPGRELVLLLSSTMLTAILGRSQVQLVPPNRLDARRPLPATLDHYSLRFRLTG